MSSNIRINRVCVFCNEVFIARKTVSKTCSDACAKKLYKRRQREKKIEASNNETTQVLERPIKELNAKDFLTVKDAATLLNCSVRTTYRLITNGTLKAINLAERKILIKRSEIDRLFI